MSDTISIAPGLKLKHVQLVALYHKNPDLKAFWQSLDTDQRLAVVSGMKEHPADQWIAHEADRTKIYRSTKCHVIAPELNIQDVCSLRSDYIFDFIEFRVNNQLAAQYDKRTALSGYNDLMNIVAFTECDPIGVLMRPDTKWALIEDGLAYGNLRLVNVLSHNIHMIPWEVARCILLRQEYIITELTAFLHHLLALKSNKVQVDILAILSKEGRRSVPRNPFDLTSTSHHGRLSELVAQCEVMQAAENEYLKSTTDNSIAFRHSVLSARMTDFVKLMKRDVAGVRPETPPMSRGIPRNGDNYINVAHYAFYDIATRKASWGYFAALLRLLQGAGKVLREAISYELASTTELLYWKAYRRFVILLRGGLLALRQTGQSGTAIGKNASTIVPVDAHTARLIQLKDTSIKHSWKWLRDLTSHYEKHPKDIRHLSLNEHGALCRFSEFIWFRKALSRVITSFGATDNQTPVWKQQMPACWVDSQTAPTEAPHNLEAFAKVVSAVCAPLVYDGRYEMFDGHIVKAVVEEFENLQLQPAICRMIEHFKKIQQQGLMQNATVSNVHSEVITNETRSQDEEQRLQAAELEVQVKVKTKGDRLLRSSQSCDNASGQNQKNLEEDDQVALSPEILAFRFKVNSKTALTFDTIFDRSQRRGRVTFSSFTDAMSKLGFAVIPKEGALTQFYPSNDMPYSYPFGIHRPHDGHWNGNRLLDLARRLKRSYGWTNNTFEVMPRAQEEKSDAIEIERRPVWRSFL